MRAETTRRAHPVEVKSYRRLYRVFWSDFARGQIQKANFEKLLTEFGGRIVLFDNDTENEAERDAQIDRLLEVVESLPSRGKRYSNIFFQAASAELAKSEAESEECDINRETLRSVSILLDKFDECNRLEDQENGADPKGQMEKWYSLLSRCDQLIDRIGNRGDQEMTDVEKKVVALRKTIQHFIKAKENESGEQVKRQAMLAAKDRLQREYRKKKAVRVGLIVGGTLLGVGVVAAAIALVVLYPPSLAVMLRVARALYPLLKRALPFLIISLPSALFTVIRAARQALSKRGNLPTDNQL
ncbi:hypothetical protein RRG08_013290 [Elysia crispata]|uniref:AIG1-type G domain-containing protein n=1 Tax=Elysia crispata TaxID=231223 RepID=A0AAE1AXK4_9GAST|nr:hypothetical protein RRG08_013290 [Elysia crispata]